VSGAPRRLTGANTSSGAYGLPQALPGSKMATVAADWRTNPHTQLVWMFGYIRDRYGNPQNAWRHSEQVGWY
jgi:resuscitation-promoting factor RpfB